MDKSQWARRLAWLWRTRWGRGTLAFLALAGAAALAGLPALVLGREFERLERAAIQQDARRVANGVQSEIRVLGEMSKDWGIWDDTYDFVVNRNPAFQKANLGWDTLLGSTQIQLIYIVNTNGEIVWGGFHPRDASHATALPAFAQERIRQLPLLLQSKEEPHSGLFLTVDGPLLLASHPIRPSSHQGPTRGTLIMGRLLDRARLTALSQLLAIPFEAADTLRNPLEPTAASAWAQQGWNPRTRIHSQSRLDILVTVPDIYGRDRVIFTLPWERTIQVLGSRASRFVFTALFLATLTATGALWLAFRQHLRLVQGYQDSLEEAVTRRTAELQEAERRFRAFIDHTNDMMFWCGLRESDGLFVLEGANPATLRFIERPLESILGTRAEDFFPASLAQPIERHIQACLAQREPLISEDTVEVRGLRMVFQTAFVPVPDETGQIRLIAGSTRDITSLREREEALLHAQKLESLGVLAGGIAHDFNNLLTAAQGNLDICTLLLPEDAEALPYMASVRHALTKAANLTRQMLVYSGRSRFVLQVHDLNVAVQEMTALLDISMSKKATLVCDLEDHLPPLQADVAQIQQVIMNLVTNASDALQDQSGTIHVRTWAETLDGEAIAELPIHFMTPGLHVALEVSDTGSGMPPEVQARIFEPFYSTKGVGRGLGLSAMLGILRCHRGGLALESAEGKGTCFRLWFPASSEPHEAAAAETALPRDGVMPTGTVLLVEDDLEIRHTTGKLLRGMGFGVIEAEDGLDGLERFHQNRLQIRLIILDLTMPRMDGREFLIELRTFAPDLPVIVSSGYSEQDLPTGDATLSFLQKPYDSSELKAAILASMSRDSGGG